MSSHEMFSTGFGDLAAFTTPGYLAPRGAVHGASRLSDRSPAMSAPSRHDDTRPPATSSDEALVAAMARGDESAATMLYDRHSAIVFGLALRVTGEQADAEEVVVETFAQAWRDAGRYDRGKGTVAGWLTIMARSRALDAVRARQRRRRATESAGQQGDGDTPVAMSQGAPPADLQVVVRERASAVAEALGALPESQRQAIELAFFEGLTHPEVAARLHEPLGTVKTRIRLGMHKLRDALARWGPDRQEGAS